MIKFHTALQANTLPTATTSIVFVLAKRQTLDFYLVMGPARNGITPIVRELAKLCTVCTLKNYSLNLSAKIVDQKYKIKQTMMRLRNLWHNHHFMIHFNLITVLKRNF